MEAPDVTALPARRNPERGNSLVLAMIVLTALGTLSVLTVFRVRGAIQTQSSDRFHSIALYAAESGAAAAMEYLRSAIDPTTGWTALVSANNDSPQAPSDIIGNDQPSGDADNPLSADLSAWYHVEIYNNRNDLGFAGGTDEDSRVIIRSTGHGPDGAIAIIEWEITSNVLTMQRPCTNYAQKGQSEANAGTNDCLGTVNSGDTDSY